MSEINKTISEVAHATNKLRKKGIDNFIELYGRNLDIREFDHLSKIPFREILELIIDNYSDFKSF